KVTGQAWALTGPSVILGYLVLAPAVLATSVAYAVFLSTPLGTGPGGEYTHISRTFGGYGIAFVGAWLKIISYVGALAYLAAALADYLIPLSGGLLPPGAARMPLALASLALVYAVHVAGVRWFGRIQVAMCAVLGLSLVVLVVPGLFAVRPSHYRPFFTHGLAGFAACLTPIFFAYAGFESLAQAAGEVRDSTRRLPSVFVRGVAATTVIYLLMSVVAFGVLPGEILRASEAPMNDVGAVYLHAAAAWFVTLGAVLALATSLNSTMLVPSRLVLVLARDRLAARWLGAIHPRTGTPVRGLTLTLAGAALLLLSGQVSLALNIAVFALVLLYLIHSVALLLLPRLNPALFGSVTVRLPLAVQRPAAAFSILAMGGLAAVQVSQDLRALREMSFADRVARQSLTTLELCAAWALVGAAIYLLERRRAARDAHD
ncbi:MAG TPA: APC family permease, partial [Vicinamibacteria bacterium]|nr:APC family permease [Vicinamibacteria bacterium]